MGCSTGSRSSCRRSATSTSCGVISYLESVARSRARDPRKPWSTHRLPAPPCVVDRGSGYVNVGDDGQGVSPAQKLQHQRAGRHLRPGVFVARGSPLTWNPMLVPTRRRSDRGHLQDRGNKTSSAKCPGRGSNPHLPKKRGV
jgi:hypothetical protein